jgi:signal transduction histidine kinase
VVTAPDRWADPRTVGAVLSRSVLLARAAVTVTAASAGVFLVAKPFRLLFLIAFVVLATVAENVVLTWWPSILYLPFMLALLDTLGALGALVIGGAGLAYFVYAAGCAAMAGALLRLRALPIVLAQAGVGYAAAARLLGDFHPPADIQVFILACPMAGVVCGIGGAVARAAVDQQVQSVVDLVSVAQRSAAASERARLARELHDSLTKTLRGVSFAALALPSSLRRHPELAEQLAATVSVGVEAAAEQARGLVTGLRLDQPERPFDQVVAATCHAWSASTGIAVELGLGPAEPAIAVRYEFLRILGEALANVERHAGARSVRVALHQQPETLRMVIVDDGRGLSRQPRGPGEGHFGIVGMSERARALGGALKVDPAAGGGTQVVVTVPMRPDEPAESVASAASPPA